jgi:hypothetical protein
VRASKPIVVADNCEASANTTAGGPTSASPINITHASVKLGPSLRLAADAHSDEIAKHTAEPRPPRTAATGN